MPCVGFLDSAAPSSRHFGSKDSICILLKRDMESQSWEAEPTYLFKNFMQILGSCQ